MDLLAVQIDPGTLRNRELVREIADIVQSAKLEYGDPIELGTAELAIYKALVGSGLPIKALWHEFDPQTEIEMFEEAQKSAQDIVRRLGAQTNLLFKGINLLEIFLFDSTMYNSKTFLWIAQVARTRKTKPGTLILVTTLPLVPSESMNSELPVRKVIQVRVRRSMVRHLLGRGLRLFRRMAPLVRFASTKWDAIPSIRDGKKRILFVVVDSERTPWSSETVVPVLRELQLHQDLVPFVVADSSLSEEYLKERGFECLAYAFYRSSDAESHWSRSESIFKEKAMELIEQYGPRTIRGLVVAVFLQRYVTRSRLSEIYSRILWLEEVFERFKPDVAVIFFTYSHLGRIAARIARIRMVPTLSANLHWPGFQKPYDFGLLDVTDFVACIGEGLKRALVASGVNPDRCILVGNPKFDAIPKHLVAQDKEYVCRLFGITPETRIFLVAVQLLSPGTSEWIHALVRQLKKFDHDKFKLIIKPHPDESSYEYERILREEEFVGAAISKGVPLFTLLSASDVVFTSVSTTGSEAVLFNKPLICINLTDIPYYPRYDEDGVALLVRREEDIMTAIETVLHDEQTRRALEIARKRFQRLYTVELGRSSECFVNAIRQVISMPRNNLVKSTHS
jgi:hypothetical protein